MIFGYNSSTNTLKAKKNDSVLSPDQDVIFEWFKKYFYGYING